MDSDPQPGTGAKEPLLQIGHHEVDIVVKWAPSAGSLFRDDSNLPGPESLADARPSSYEPAEETAALPTDSIPGYSIVREIHRGGQGVIYQAIQKTTRRKVAIKVMREGPFGGHQDKTRFEREVQILAALKHPNIVAIHESGIADNNHFFVMDYISGQPLDEYMGAARRTVRETLALFQKICEAVSAAHLRGIVHRDLKPGNIRIDAEGQPQILDFGLAKVAPGQIDDQSVLMTMTGQFLGSLHWASPEQAEGVPSRIDIRTDVYSLGVILYKLLTGVFPYDVSGGFHDVLERIMTATPVRPHTLRREIDDEVETIVLKSLAKERERRYQWAGELGRDIGHYLDGEPIEAKRDSALYVLKKSIRRYRTPVAVAAGFVLMLGIGFLVSLALWRQAAKERDRALRAESQARDAEGLAMVARDGERRQREAADQQRALAQERERTAHLAYAAGALEEGTALLLAGRGQDSRDAFIRARSTLTELNESTLSAEVGLYRALREFTAPINSLSGHSDGLMSVAWLPDGAHACSAAEDGTVRLWDVRTGREIRAFRGHTGVVTSVAVSPDGRRLLSGGEDKTVRLFNVATGEEIRVFTDPIAQIRGVAFSPDGRFAVSAPAEPGGSVRLWDITGNKLARAFDAPRNEAYYGVAFSPDGQRLLATTYDKTIWVWDANTGRALRALTGHTGYVISAVFSPDGRHVLSASYDHTLRLWNVATGETLQVLKGHSAGVRGAAYVGDDRALSCSMDGSLKLWDLQTGDAVRTFSGHADGTRSGIRGLTVSPDGRRAISAGIDKTLKVWDLTPGRETPAVSEAGVITSLSCSADGRIFISGDRTGAVTIRDTATLRVLRRLAGHGRAIASAALLPDGQHLFSSDCSGNAKLWDIRTGHELRSYAGKGQGDCRYIRGREWSYTSLSPDGRLFLSSTPDNGMDLRSVDSGDIVRTFPPCRRYITCVVMSPDGKHALCGDENGDIYYWDLDSGQCLFSMPVGPKPGSVDCAVFSADGKEALTSGHDLTVRWWDLAERRKLREFAGPTLVVKGIEFGRGTVFSVGGDQTLRMWDAKTGHELKNLAAQFPEYCNALAVVPPGDAVLVGSGDSISLWNVSRAVRHLEFAPRAEAARSALRFNPNDAAALLTLGQWYAFRGIDDWAVQLLEQARAAGGAVPSLTLAHCYWQLDRPADAAREFRSALVHSEAAADYLNLCLTAVTSATTSSAPAILR